MLLRVLAAVGVVALVLWLGLAFHPIFFLFLFVLLILLV